LKGCFDSTQQGLEPCQGEEDYNDCISATKSYFCLPIVSMIPANSQAIIFYEKPFNHKRQIAFCGCDPNPGFHFL
jgi:hypothetical protein